MTREQERAIAVQDGAYKVLSGQSATMFYIYQVDNSLFKNQQEFVNLVTLRVREMES